MKTVYFDINGKLSDEVPSPLGLALGYFDGMHRGHQLLLSKARYYSPGYYGALLFDDGETLPGKEKEILSTLGQKLSYLNFAQADVAIILPSRKELFDLSKEEFIKRFLSPLKPKVLFVGEDFRFGKGAKGEALDLKKLSEVLQVPLMEEGGSKISSSRIKSLIKEGDMEMANWLLGHPYQMVGHVIEGFHLGRTIGFPTANLKPDADFVLPKAGVYAGIAYHHGKPYFSIINVGINPTVGKLKEPRIEAHLADFDEEIYGDTLYLYFGYRLRDEAKFASLEELKAQLKKDLAKTLELYTTD